MKRVFETGHGRVRRTAGLTIFLICAAGFTASAQTAGPLASATVVTAASDASQVDGEVRTIRLLAGRSALVNVGAPITRVSLTSSDIADAMVTTPTQLLVHGKEPGTISMFVWERAGGIRRYELTIFRDLDTLADQVKHLFPGEPIAVESNGKNVVLSGQVSSKVVADQLISLASGYVEKKEDVVNLLQARRADQVLLRVRFAEVSRSAMSQLGASFALDGYKDGRWFGRSTTQQFAAPEWDTQGRMVFSDFLNIFMFDAQNGITGVIKALQERGLFQSLAEPNLVAESGSEASFLAGGEIPVPIAQGSGNNVAITVQYKEFGIRLTFTPVVTGDRIHLKVRPEVSSLDFGNGVVLQGFRIPGLITRRTETSLELGNGQTFAIAGLLNNTVNSSMQKIPGIGDIPILGLLFRSKAAQKEQTELVVMITPEILPNNSPGVTPNLPRLQEQFLSPLPPNRSHEPPPAAFPRVSTGNPGPTAVATGDRATVPAAGDVPTFDGPRVDTPRDADNGRGVPENTPSNGSNGSNGSSQAGTGEPPNDAEEHPVPTNGTGAGQASDAAKPVGEGAAQKKDNCPPPVVEGNRPECPKP
jgi:pilus assembly protein CpaC